jgi:hypothetical protein
LQIDHAAADLGHHRVVGRMLLLIVGLAWGCLYVYRRRWSRRLAKPEPHPIQARTPTGRAVRRPAAACQNKKNDHTVCKTNEMCDVIRL